MTITKSQLVLALAVAIAAAAAIGLTQHREIVALHAQLEGPQASPTATRQPGGVGGVGRALDPKLWDTVSAGDTSSVIARLRAAGFPPYVIRSVVAAMVSEPFKRKRADILASAEPRPYWRNSGWGGMFDPKSQAAWEASTHEQYVAVQEATEGLAENDDPMGVILRRARYGDLPQATIKVVSKIQDDYSQMINEVYRDARGTLLPEDQEKLAYLQKEQAADLAKALTPEEYESYELHSSETAQRLKSKLTAFDATEAEYKAIFDVQRKVDVQFAGNSMGTRSQEDMDQQAAAQKEADAQIAAALGPDRYAQYQAETDPGYIQTNQIVQRLNLPAETTGKVVEIQKSMQAQFSAIQSDSSLSKADKATELSALADQANSQLGDLLGPRGLKDYSNSQGYWITNLKTQAR